MQPQALLPWGSKVSLGFKCLSSSLQKAEMTSPRKHMGHQIISLHRNTSENGEKKSTLYFVIFIISTSVANQTEYRSTFKMATVSKWKMKHKYCRNPEAVWSRWEGESITTASDTTESPQLAGRRRRVLVTWHSAAEEETQSLSPLFLMLREIIVQSSVYQIIFKNIFINCNDI